MQRLFSLLVLMLPAVAVSATTMIRRLEDASYYGQDGYFKFSKCLRVKIVEDNDDDGNAYFYNGAYRSQSLAYASFIKCEEGCGDSTCDPTVAYVAQLDEALEDGLQYSQGYCNSCLNNCRRRRRRLDEGGDDENNQNNNNGFSYSPDCDTCESECAYFSNNNYNNNNANNGGGGNDETAYLECQYSYTDDQGLAYYSAPTCANDGSMVMGLFYDGTSGIPSTVECAEVLYLLTSILPSIHHHLGYQLFSYTQTNAPSKRPMTKPDSVTRSITARSGPWNPCA